MHSTASPAAAPRLSRTVSPRRPSRVSFAPPTPAVGLELGSVLQTPLSHRLPPRWDSSSDLLGSALQTPTAVRSKIREIFMPALSSTMTEGKIVSWIKSEGGSVVVVVGSQLHHDRGYVMTHENGDTSTTYRSISANRLQASTDTTPFLTLSITTCRIRYTRLAASGSLMVRSA
uniref:Lipoyl-binding domain-containing protein n=1 Tax=Fagus sylvatica TaxID=28930 RepID=A0A2N9HIJ4_FAGSY